MKELASQWKSLIVPDDKKVMAKEKKTRSETPLHQCYVLIVKVDQWDGGLVDITFTLVNRDRPSLWKTRRNVNITSLRFVEDGKLK